MSYADKEHLFPMQGGCPCGHIRYQLALPPLLVHACHCLSCQRETGSAMAVNAITESSAVTLLPPASTSPSPAAAVHPAFARLTDAQLPPPTSDTTPASPLLVLVPSGSGLGQCVVRCPVCFVALWSHYADGKALTYLRVGTLDNGGADIQPDAHIFTRSKKAFVTLDDGKPQFEESYPDRAAFYRPGVAQRLAALKPAMEEWNKALIAGLASETQ